jgi:hypothetical protein
MRPSNENVLERGKIYFFLQDLKNSWRGICAA